MTTEFILAGFGGQGILFAGKILAYCGLMAGKELSWLPSYGPEMRGGTANCSVCISDEPIGSPLVTHPGLSDCNEWTILCKICQCREAEWFDSAGQLCGRGNRSTGRREDDCSSSNGYGNRAELKRFCKYDSAGQNAGRNQAV